MSKDTANPSSTQVASSQKECIPELIAKQLNLYHQVFRFNGEISKANSILIVGGKHVSTDILMKPNCSCAISQSNKRYLEECGLITDYVEPNPQLFSCLGFSAHESKRMVYSKILDMLPMNFIITGYRPFEKITDAPKPEVGCALKNGVIISREEAIKVLADWFMDNDFYSSIYDDMPEFEHAVEAADFAKISPKAAVYGIHASPDDGWEALEFATLYDLSVKYVDYLAELSLAIYSLLAEKYEKAGILLVNTNFAFGINEEDEICLGYEVGTPDTSVLASKALYKRYGNLKSIEQIPVMKYFESIAYTGENDLPVPEVPEHVLEEVTDTYMYLAEALCDELAFKMHM